MFENDNMSMDWSKMNNLLKVVNSEISTEKLGGRGPKGVSGYKGVCSTRNNTWRSVVYVDKKQVYLGMYDSPFDAAIAYDRYVMNFVAPTGVNISMNFTSEFHECMP